MLYVDKVFLLSIFTKYYLYKFPWSQLIFLLYLIIQTISNNTKSGFYPNVRLKFI